jgi:dolichyl-phosphate-mannose-protein mannosyltransferase
MTDAPASEQTPAPSASPIKLHHALLVGILLLAAFTRIWRLGEPPTCYFDEVYFPTTAAEILNGQPAAWEFVGHENTHPPLSKDLMAVSEAVFGVKSYAAGSGNGCFSQKDDPDKVTNPDWQYDPFGFRFPGALAGVFSVLFIYLIAKRLFKSEVAALTSALLLAMDGLVLTQSRIATPDTFVLCFLLASIYYLLKRNWLLSGLFVGASAASKWIGAFTMFPIVLYFGWTAYRRWREAGEDKRLRKAERVLLAGCCACVLGVLTFGAVYALHHGLSATAIIAGGVPFALGAFVIGGGLVAILTEPALRNLPRAKVYVRTAVSFPVFFLAAPFAVYMASYIPMFLEGHGLSHWWELNDSAYKFHSSLTTPHPSESAFYSWPIDFHPVFFYVQDYAKIYNLGNPIIFWMSIPALVFTFWQAVRFVRVHVEPGARLLVWGQLGPEQAALLFVVLGYLGFWLALSRQERALFLYHYEPALAFAVLALGYTAHWLWHNPNRLGRYAVITSLLMWGAAFIYFFPHWTAIDVPQWLDGTYYWFHSWQ